MLIKLYGTRGSIAVANKETKKYGGNTTCLYVESAKGDSIIVDSGTGIRELGIDLLQNKKRKLHLIFTHFHWDHIQGFPFFAPLFFKKFDITIYGSKKELEAKKALKYQMTPPYFPATLDDVQAKMTFKEIKSKIKIGSMGIETIPTNHPNFTLGLKFIEGKKSFVFLTDNELHAKNGRTTYKKFVNFIKGSKFFIHDAQYTDEIYPNKLGWGHSTFSQVMKLSDDSGVKNIVLTHHDPPNGDKFIDDMLKSLRKKHPEKNIQAAADGKTIILK